MGGLFTRSIATDLELPRALRDASVSESEARSSRPLRVLGCPRCQKRLCALDRDGQGAAAVWKAPSSRVERALFGGATSFKCRMCGQGRIAVEALGDAAQPDGEQGGGATLPVLVSLKATTAKGAFRPFSACVCGMYESVVARATALLEAEAITTTRQLNVSQHTFKRSELAKLSEDELPKPPMELLVIAHKVSGQRNPITDQHGLYNNLLRHAWNRADVVILVLFDVPPGYFSQLLSEQPTLRGLLCAGRLLPLFSKDDTGESADAEANLESRKHEEAQASGWLVRCLDGRVPRHEGLPPDNAKSSEVVAALAGVADEAKEGTIAVLARVVEDFEGHELVRD